MVSDVSTLTELDPSDHHGVLSLQRAQPVNPVVPLTFTFHFTSPLIELLARVVELYFVLRGTTDVRRPRIAVTLSWIRDHMIGSLPVRT